MIDVTCACPPPIWAAMSPQKFSAATTLIVPGGILSDADVELPHAASSTTIASRRIWGARAGRGAPVIVRTILIPKSSRALG